METLFECNATGIPAPGIEFFLNGSRLESNENFSLLDPVTEDIDLTDDGDVVQLVTGRLSISRTLDGNSNNYSCVATNINGSDSVEFELIVWGKPQVSISQHSLNLISLSVVAPAIVDGPESQIVLENEAVVLSCVSEGRPPPMIQWSKQSTEVAENERVGIETVLRGARRVVSNLTIQSALPLDAAQYTCSATNLAGDETRSADLTVHGRPMYNVHLHLFCVVFV